MQLLNSPRSLRPFGWLIGGLALGASAHAGPAPLDVKRGMMSSSGVGLLTDDATGTAQLVVRVSGAAAGAPAEWSSGTFGPATGTHPDYSMAALRAHWPTVDFASISTGGDIAPLVDMYGQLNMSNIWYAFAVTVDSGTLGVPGSIIDQQRMSAGMPTGTIYSYYAEGSTGIAASYADSVMREQLPAQVGLPASTALNGLDFGSGVISNNPNGGGGPMFPYTDRIFFTVTHDWAMNNSALFVNNPLTSTPEQISSATIYRMNWTPGPSSQWTWSTPEIAVSFSQLMLDETEEVDALSYYSRGPIDQVVFSTNPEFTPMVNARDEILVFQRDGATILCQTTPLKTMSGAHVSAKFGLRPRTPILGTDPDNVTGGCGWDPEAFGDHTRAIGIPEYSIPVALDDDLGISVVRAQVLAPDGASYLEVLHCEASGIALRAGLAGQVGLFVGMSDAASATGAYTMQEWAFLGAQSVTPGTDSVSWDFPAGLAASPTTRLHFGALLIDFDSSNNATTLRQQSAMSVIRY